MAILFDVYLYYMYLYIFNIPKTMAIWWLTYYKYEWKTNNFIKKNKTLNLNPLLVGWVGTLYKEIKIQQDGTFTLIIISLIKKKPLRVNKYNQFLTH